jgi:hypothetical protein
MSAPTRSDQEALWRIARYFCGAPRIVYEFEGQPPADLEVFSDTDFAGCFETRRSTRGGVALRGCHAIWYEARARKL